MGFGDSQRPWNTDQSKPYTVYPSAVQGHVSAVPADNYRAAPAQQKTLPQSYQTQSKPTSCTVCAIVAGVLFGVLLVAAAIVVWVIIGIRDGSSTSQTTTPASYFNISKPCDKTSRFQCAGDTSAKGCIPLSWKCDGFKDCVDNSDETNCPCNTATQYACTLGGCFNKIGDLCDRYADCRYIANSTYPDDEQFCSATCPSSFGFKCRTTPFCIPWQYMCGGYTNLCKDLSDEIVCPCKAAEFECISDTICVSLNYWCDGRKDCRDGSDEPPGCQTRCPNNGVRCQVSGVCMNPGQICDHISDCLDGSDEQNCPCTSSEYRCSDSRCISKLWLCDGTRDCSSGEDETLQQCYTCSSSQFRCRYTSSTTCISSTQQCDGLYQCSDTSDEGGCVTNNETSSFGENLLLVKYQGASNRYVCSDNWNETLSYMACKQLGSAALGASVSAVTVPPSSLLLTLNSSSINNSSNLLSYLKPAVVCSTNSVVSISCRPATCGTRTVNANTTGPYIVNGQLAARGAWPWQVLVVYDNNIICGGSLLNDRWVLTAGHCAVDYSNVSLLEVRAGSLLFDSSVDVDAQIFRVDRIRIHPSFANLITIRNVVINDVTLLHLTTSAIFTDTVRPICLPSPDVNLAQFKVCVATGFGDTRKDAAEVSSVLLQGKMQLITASACLSASKVLTNVTWNAKVSDFQLMVCAGNIPAANGMDICQGDSGGPLACKDQQDVWSLIGVTSFGFSCQLSIFARVSAYISWISSVIGSSG